MGSSWCEFQFKLLWFHRLYFVLQLRHLILCVTNQIPSQRDFYQCGIIVLRMMENIVQLALGCDFDMSKIKKMKASDIGFPGILNDLDAQRQRIARVIGTLFESGCRPHYPTLSQDDVDNISKFNLHSNFSWLCLINSMSIISTSTDTGNTCTRSS